MSFALQARVVFPVDRPPIEHGVVTIDGERIVAVGAKADAGEVIDLGSVALLPGLVNCHTHLEFSHLRRPLGVPGMRLVDWIRLVIASRGHGDDASDSIAAGLAEGVRGGVTTVGDITQTSTEKYANTAIDLTLLAEVIGFSHARAESAFASVRERLDGLAVHSHVQVGISPHAPYTVSPDLLKRLIALANERAVPVAMHLAESAEELELLDAGTGPFQELLDERSMWDAEVIPFGSRPMDYLRMLAEAPRALVIHGNYLDEHEQSFLGEKADHMSLVYCPRTHEYFRHPPYPLAELLNKNVRVALGTDSRASNPDLNLLAEMRQVAQTFPTIDPQQILRMGTLSGAEALGRAAEVGSITPDKLANLVAMPLASDASGKPDDLLTSTIDNGESPCVVWIHGEEMRS